MNLLEQYKPKLAVSEAVYKRAHGNEAMDTNKKLLVAACLKNVDDFINNTGINEAFDAGQATQRSDMGLWKKFCLNLTTVALPC